MADDAVDDLIELVRETVRQEVASHIAALHGDTMALSIIALQAAIKHASQQPDPLAELTKLRQLAVETLNAAVITTSDDESNEIVLEQAERHINSHFETATAVVMYLQAKAEQPTEADATDNRTNP